MTEIASIQYGQTGKSTEPDTLGMRPMQARAWRKRGETHLLVKSPPASGKSRAVMYIALDKLHNQGLRKVIITVPQSIIGASFSDEPLSKSDFFWDWTINKKWDLCSDQHQSRESTNVKLVDEFLESADSDDCILICAHATFRQAVVELGYERFDECLIALDEVHHASDDEGFNVLGDRLSKLIKRNKAHIVAMTGTFFRGDLKPVLSPEDESRFETVVYTGHEQLDGYKYLKSLLIEHSFFDGSYIDSIMNVVDTKKKTIIYIPSVNTKQTSNKKENVDSILEQIGEVLDPDPETGFRRVKCAKTKNILKVADLVNDDPDMRKPVVNSLRDRTQKDNPKYLDIVIALNMAKEGFDWIWAEHVVAVGDRGSLTEIVQIMGRVTRDAPGKSEVRFTNMISDPEADDITLVESVNDRVKAIFMGLLMEKVYAPVFKIRPRSTEPLEDEYSTDDADADTPHQDNSQELPAPGTLDIEGLPRLSEQHSKQFDFHVNDMIREVMLDATTIKYVAALGDNSYAHGEGVYIDAACRAISDRFSEASESEKSALVKWLQVQICAYEGARRARAQLTESGDLRGSNTNGAKTATARKSGILAAGDGMLIDVNELNIDLIESFQAFATARLILAKEVNSSNLREVENMIKAKRHPFTDEQLKEHYPHIKAWFQKYGVPPKANSTDLRESDLGRALAQINAAQQ